jgi:hypothetical protein
MALVINDRVKETTTTTGTGAVSLAGAVTGFETFAAGVGNSNTTYYCIAHQTAAEFEVGLGTLDGDSSDLTRTTVISSSNSDSAVDFAAGTKDVFCTIPASKLIFEDANNDATVGRNLTVTGDLTVSGDDITMGTNTAGHLLIADGTNFNAIAVGDLSAISSVASDDVLMAVDTSGGGLKKITRSNLVSGLAAGTMSNVVDDTSPQLGGNLDTNSANILIDDAHFIADENGNEQIIFQTTSSAVNQFDFTNAATGSGPTISSTGGDTNINLNLTPKGSGVVMIDGNVGIDSGKIDLKNGGTASQILFYCESSNAHAQTLIAAPHSEGATNTLTLPGTGGDARLVSTASTATLTNKTLTSPKINEDVAVTTTATEINLIDGGTSRGTTAVASGDGILINDGGTMRMTNVDTVSTYFAGHSVGGSNIVTTGALNSGSITSGFGTINTGSSAITTTGLISGGSLDIDDVLINGTTIGHTDDTDLITVADGLVTVAGEISVTTLDIGGTNVASTAAELNIVDGNTSATSTTLADADRVVTNDNGTMVQVALSDVKTYLSSAGFSTEDPTALAIALG